MQIHLIEVGCYLGGTSSTSVAVGTGSKTWTLTAGSPIPTEGMTLRVIKTSDANTYMEGVVVSASETTVTMHVTTTGGSGTHTAWTFTSGTLRYTNGTEYVHVSAPGYYDPCVMLSMRGSQSIFGDGKTFGAAQVSVGSIKLANIDGSRDRLRTYGFYGRPTRILVGDSLADYSTFVTYITGTIEQPVVSQTDVLFRFRDRLAELSKPIIATRYLGDNVRPNGVEGNAEDLAGRFKPLLRGYAKNFQPILCNDSKLVYQISAKQIHGIGWVKDGGVTLTTGSAKTTLADLLGTTKTFTVTAASTTATSTAHGYVTGTYVGITSTTTAPLPVISGSFYYLRSTGTDTFTIHPTLGDATGNTNAVTFTTTGTGTHSVFNCPAPATVDYYLGNDGTGEGAYIRPGTRPGFTLTVEAWEGATAADRYVGAIFARVMQQDAGFTTADFSASDTAALDTAAPFETGFWIVGGGSEEDMAQPVAPGMDGEVSGATSVREALDKIFPDVRGWYAPDQDGVHRCGQISIPSGTAAATFKRFDGTTVAGLTDFDIVSIELLATGDTSRGVPLCRLGVKHAPNYTVQQKGDLGGDPASASDPVGGLTVRETLKRQYSVVNYPTTQSASVITKYGVAVEQDFVTSLRHAVNAATLATDLFAIYGTQRDRFKVTARLSKELIPIIRLGEIIGVEIPRYGLNSGKIFMIIGVDYQPETGTVVLDVWGAAT